MAQYIRPTFSAVTEIHRTWKPLAVPVQQMQSEWMIQLLKHKRSVSYL